MMIIMIIDIKIVVKKKSVNETLDTLNSEISDTIIEYRRLLKKIADETVMKYLEQKFDVVILEKDKQRFKRTIPYAFQQYTEEHISRIFEYNAEHIDPNYSYFIQELKTYEPYFHSVLKDYIYKKFVSHFTKGNILSVLNNYNEYNETDNTLNSLLCAMKDSSTYINKNLLEIWSMDENLSKYESTDCGYRHSGGNLFTILAGVICYIQDKNHKGNLSLGSVDYEYEKIFISFKYWMKKRGRLDTFLVKLYQLFESKIFCDTITPISQSIGDLDFIFMTKNEKYVKNAMINPISQLISKVSTHTLVQILYDVYNTDPEDIESRLLFPFFQKFDRDFWKEFRYFNLSGVKINIHEYLSQREGISEKEAKKIMNDMIGYRLSSNKIPELPIFLNRLKQGYLTFQEIELSHEKEELENNNFGEKNINFSKKTYSTKYGECLDLVIGDTNNSLYKHKFDKNMEDEYYSIENLLEELNEILSGPTDDKSDKRKARQYFLQCLMGIDEDFTYEINILFKIIAHYIDYNTKMEDIYDFNSNYENENENYNENENDMGNDNGNDMGNDNGNDNGNENLLNQWKKQEPENQEEEEEEENIENNENQEEEEEENNENQGQWFQGQENQGQWFQGPVYNEIINEWEKEPNHLPSTQPLGMTGFSEQAHKMVIPQKKPLTFGTYGYTSFVPQGNSKPWGTLKPLSFKGGKTKKKKRKNKKEKRKK